MIESVHACGYSFPAHKPFIFRFLLLSALVLLSHATTAQASHQRALITVPILVVAPLGDKSVGAPSYVVVQVDHLNQPAGPEVLFNEGSRGFGAARGSTVSPDWKEAAQQAALAASQALGEDPRSWQVTIKEVSIVYVVDGPSASAALAVAMVAAKRGAPILPGIVITGAIDVNGRITTVGALPEKIQGAAAAGFSTILIPSGETRTRDWDLRPLSESLHVTILEVPTLKDAYEKMTGRSF